MRRKLTQSVAFAALLLAGCDFYYDRVPSPDDLL